MAKISKIKVGDTVQIHEGLDQKVLNLYHGAGPWGIGYYLTVSTSSGAEKGYFYKEDTEMVVIERKKG